MKHYNVLSLPRLLLLVGMTVSGCSFLSPQEDRTRYFVLVAAADVARPEAVVLYSRDRPLTIGLGPVSIPQYLNRPEVVTRLSDTEFSVSDTDTWGEPLDVSVSRVLKQDLSTEYPALQILPFPWSSKAQIDYRVSVEFQRLERTANGQAEVQAVWSIRTNEGRMLQTGHTRVTNAAGNDQKSASTALSSGIAQVSGDIAQALAKHSVPKITQ